MPIFGFFGGNFSWLAKRGSRLVARGSGSQARKIASPPPRRGSPWEANLNENLDRSRSFYAPLVIRCVIVTTTRCISSGISALIGSVTGFSIFVLRRVRAVNKRRLSGKTGKQQDQLSEKEANLFLTTISLVM